MSKIFSSLAAVAVILTFLFLPVHALAKTTPSPTVSVDQPLTGQVQTEVKAEYQLPYPGLLPDHPLYVLKAIRDRILDMLIVDPVRKSEFYILQGDKRLQMGMLLMDKGRGALAEQVISKGEKYMYQALYSLVSLKNEGKAMPGYVVDRLEKSLTKHEEVLGELVQKAGDLEKAGFVGSLELVGKLQDELPRLK